MTQISEEKHCLAFENLLKFIATSDISFNAVDNNFLRETFIIFDESFILPGRDKLRNEMVNLSQKIHNEMLQELSGKTVSMLFDGCHRWSNEYQGIILFTKARLYLYELTHTDDSKAQTIADVIS